MIRFIFTIYSANRDRNGNTEHFAHLRSTKTGKAVAWHSHSAGNAQRELCKALGITWLKWEELHYVETALPIREWGRMAKALDASYTDVTADTITALEQIP